MKKKLTTDEWVRRLNQLGDEIHDLENAMHPTAWPEQLADLQEEYRQLAGQETYDPPEQMELGL